MVYFYTIVYYLLILLDELQHSLLYLLPIKLLWTHGPTFLPWSIHLHTSLPLFTAKRINGQAKGCVEMDTLHLDSLSCDNSRLKVAII